MLHFWHGKTNGFVIIRMTLHTGVVDVLQSPLYEQSEDAWIAVTSLPSKEEDKEYLYYVRQLAYDR